MIVLDRFEGSYAVLETDSGSLDIPREQLPQSACEGDVLELNEGRYIVNEAATAERRSKMLSKLKKLTSRQ
jgi:hypothetical protein